MLPSCAAPYCLTFRVPVFEIALGVLTCVYSLYVVAPSPERARAIGRILVEHPLLVGIPVSTRRIA